MSFANIIGQDAAIRFLKGAIDKKKVAHAYIFLGPVGVGKKLAAVNFAKALNCLGQDEACPCDACIPCKKIDASNHPDVFTISAKGDNPSVKIDDIRALIRTINLKSYEGRFKVYIIDDAHSMTEEAANALLKTLEEPPQDSVIILIAETASALPKTIVSRSQIVRFFPLAQAVVKDILLKAHGLDEVNAHILSHITMGRLGEAIRFKEEDFFVMRSRIIDALINNNFLELDLELSQKESYKIFLGVMSSWYRDIMLNKLGSGAGALLINIDKRDAISREAARYSLNFLDNMIKEIALTSSAIDRNANPKLAINALGANLCMK